MRKAIVTGAAGFIGSHLVDSLLHDGWEVIGVDNLHTGSVRNLDSALQNPLFQFIEHDVRKPYGFRPCDVVYNLACPASPIAYQRDPIYTAEVCFLGALNALRYAMSCGATVVQASTSEIYGNPLVHPQIESYFGNVNPIGPRSCYDEGKRIAETLFSDYRVFHGVDSRIVRIFNTYGPRLDPRDGRVISNFIVASLSGCPHVVYGDGRATRSLCYVADTVVGIRLVASTNRYKCPVNIGNPHELTIAEISGAVCCATDTNTGVQFVGALQDDPLIRRPDISEAASLGWAPLVGIQRGLRNTVDYFRRTHSL